MAKVIDTVSKNLCVQAVPLEILAASFFGMAFLFRPADCLNHSHTLLRGKLMSQKDIGGGPAPQSEPAFTNLEIAIRPHHETHLGRQEVVLRLVKFLWSHAQLTTYKIHILLPKHAKLPIQGMSWSAVSNEVCHLLETMSFLHVQHHRKGCCIGALLLVKLDGCCRVPAVKLEVHDSPCPWALQKTPFAILCTEFHGLTQVLLREKQPLSGEFRTTISSQESPIYPSFLVPKLC
mmetsp:Transcript_83969/g.133077  ORF Transcript_83969/g.133077 Transcript_83969/m.133077 type:complete len:234 (-) Transcript_83969:941-1642(-)